MNRPKIINDPVYGFITIPQGLIYELIEHPWFQRLRRIRQLGLTHYVYPGALHTRFHHALGAMHLMQQATEIIKSKGHEITAEESEAVLAAILLHDIGHSPFSHALEHSIISGIKHEVMSALFMDELNKVLNGRLSLAIKIFRDEYHKKFLHQLVSGQLDMDRLDYLSRDSFYTGVSEGIISYDRILKMLDVQNDELVIDIKGIYSIEKFIIARRLMYWQVYLHKTVISAEQMLIMILKRAKELFMKGKNLFATPVLHYFLQKDFTGQDLKSNGDVLRNYALLDDYDIFSAIKVWCNADDKILSELCKRLVNRRLFKVKLQNIPFDEKLILELKDKAKHALGINDAEANYCVLTSTIENNAYNPEQEKINILFKDGKVLDVTKASDQLSISAVAKSVRKYFLCYYNV